MADCFIIVTVNPYIELTLFIGDGTNGRDAGNLGLVEGKSLENGVAYRFTVDVTAGVSSAVLTVEKVER